jgi:hypothetical protein
LKASDRIDSASQAGAKSTFVTSEVNPKAPQVTNGPARVGVLLVHGVNAPVPDPNFSTLKAVASLLENHDFKKKGFTYTPSSVKRFSIPVTGVPPVPPDLEKSDAQIDRGNAAMIEAIKDFKMEESYWPTERRETKRVSLNTNPDQKTVQVDLYELYWADLSRPSAFSFLNSLLAFLSLLFSACSLGRKSLDEAIRRVKGASVGDSMAAFNAGMDLRLFQLISLCQRSIEQSLTAVLPTLNLWVAGAAWTYYLLTLKKDAHDAVVPTIAGLSAMGWYLRRYASVKMLKVPWQQTTAVSLAIGLLTCFLVFQIGTNVPFGCWISAILCGIIPAFLAVHLYFMRPEMGRFQQTATAVSVLALFALGYELLLKIPNAQFWESPYPATAWKSTVILWNDSICTGLSLTWAAIAGLNFLFLAGSSILSAIAKNKPDWDWSRRAIRTALISNTAPALVLLVLTLGCWQIVAWLLGLRHVPNGVPDHYLFPVHLSSGVLGSVHEVHRAASLWYQAIRHPWIQFAYLWFIVIAVLLIIAIAPNVRLEIIGVVKKSSAKLSTWVSQETDAFFEALDFAASAIAKVMGITAPLMLFAVACFHPSVMANNAIPAWARWIFAGAALIYFLCAIGLCLRRSGEPLDRKRILLTLLSIAVTAASIGVVALKFNLNVVWALPLSALILLTGIVFVFKVILDAALDVVSWLRLTPRRNNPRGQIVARLSALMRKIESENYDGMVILAHSQGAVIVVEYLRYLELIGQQPKNLINLFTVGCPLRQLYSPRFPDVYSWVGTTAEQAKQRLTPPISVSKWINGFTTGDYIGRNFWCSDAEREVPSQPSILFSDNREEMCFGAGAHIGYFNWRFARVAEELDRLISDAASQRPQLQQWDGDL